jgi:hypothetical protein
MFSDNGMNFCGDDIELQKVFPELDDENSNQEFSRKRIRWHCIPGYLLPIL